MTLEQAQQGGLDCLRDLHCGTLRSYPPCRCRCCWDGLRCTRVHQPCPPCGALLFAGADGARQIEFHLCDQCVGVAAVVGGDHGLCVLKSWIPSAALPRSRPWGRAGGGGWWSAKKKPAVAGYVEKKTPPLRPSLADGDNGGVFNVAGVGRLFHGGSPGARHLSEADVPSREQSGRLARQVQPGRVRCPYASALCSLPAVCSIGGLGGALAGGRMAQRGAAPARRQPR